MPTPLSPKIRQWLNIKAIFAVCACALLVYNLTALTKKVRTKQALRQKIPYIFPGYKFSGLTDTLQGVQYIGYYTDKDLDKNEHARQFAQAQYVVTPVILDLNNTDHPFVLFDCADPQAAWRKIREIGAQPLQQNQFGIILAKNPKFQK